MCCLCFHYSVSVLVVTAIGTGFVQLVKSRRSNKSYRIFLYIFLPFFASYNEINKFWKFAVCFREGFLHCLTGEKLADAPTTKKILKSWKTDPIDSSKSEELLKR